MQLITTSGTIGSRWQEPKERLRGAERRQPERNEQVPPGEGVDLEAFRDPWETLTPLRRQMALCSVLLQLQRRHLDILALIGMAPLISTPDVAVWMHCSETTIHRRARDLRALGLCDEMLLPMPLGGLPSASSHQIEHTPLACLRLRPAGRALLAAIYGRAAHQVPFRLRDIAVPTAHDTGIHRFRTLLAIASGNRAARRDPGTGIAGQWWCDAEHCALSFDTADIPVKSGAGGTDHPFPRERCVVPDAIGEWRWTDPDDVEHITTFWLEWDTDTEGEAKIRNKLERYAMHVQQLKLAHWADTSYQAPPLLFVVPNHRREAWLATAVHDIIVEWTSWQEERERSTQKFVKAQPYPIDIYSTTIAHLAQAEEGPLSEVWLQIAPIPLDPQALLALEEVAEYEQEQLKQERIGTMGHIPDQPAQQTKNSQHRLQGLWSAVVEAWHMRQAPQEQANSQAAYPSVQSQKSFQQAQSYGGIEQDEMLVHSCPLEWRQG